jgi:hypothetical protein
MAAELRARGHDAEAVLERADLIQRPDEVVFESARSEQRAIVTENVPDYRRLAAELMQRRERHYGLVLTSNRGWPRHVRTTFARLVDALDELAKNRPEVDSLRDGEWWP